MKVLLIFYAKSPINFKRVLLWVGKEDETKLKCYIDLRIGSPTVFTILHMLLEAAQLSLSLLWYGLASASRTEYILQMLDIKRESRNIRGFESKQRVYLISLYLEKNNGNKFLGFWDDCISNFWNKEKRLSVSFVHTLSKSNLISQKANTL